ncbi:MAG: ThiF family adenylyltransferase [Candidatus Micrarchaeota archaeon]
MKTYDEKFSRNRLTKAQQEKVRRAAFAIVGLGGTGGFILENLLRMGAENLAVFENDRFELSNFNRQTLATDEFLDMPKAHAAVSRAKTINTSIRLDTRGVFWADTSLADADIVLDGSDNIKTKLAVSRSARRAKIPYVFCSAQSTRGIVTVFTAYRFEKAFQLPKDEGPLEKYATCPDILCPAASLAGTIAASQAVNVLIKKPFIKAPQALFFDLFRKDIFWRGKLG